jgi:hypothetical protein
VLHELSCITKKKGIPPFLGSPSERNNQQHEQVPTSAAPTPLCRSTPYNFSAAGILSLRVRI